MGDSFVTTVWVSKCNTWSLCMAICWLKNKWSVWSVQDMNQFSLLRFFYLLERQTWSYRLRVREDEMLHINWLLRVSYLDGYINSMFLCHKTKEDLTRDLFCILKSFIRPLIVLKSVTVFLVKLLFKCI